MDRIKIVGFIYSLSAFFFWGLFPIYWKLLKHVSPLEVLSHRIIWCFVLVASVLLFRKRWPASKLFSRRDLLLLITTGILVGSSWLIYIIAVNSDRILDASMGYYINPLMSIFLGMTVIKERLEKIQLVAFGLAITGVIYTAINHGTFPWIALSLSSLFALYGLVKKISRHDPLQALGVEAMLLSPLALGFIIFAGASGDGAFVSGGTATTLLLVFAGIITALPLYLFAEGVMRIQLSSVGFTQFITPSMMLLIGTFVYGEEFSRTRIVSFGLIWIAVALYSISVWRSSRSVRPGLSGYTDSGGGPEGPHPQLKRRFE